MASQKPQRTPEEIEDIILRKIFLVALKENPENPSSSDPRVVYLEMTAAEILSEGKRLLLSRDLMERVLIDRLSGEFPNSEPPFNYLIGCYKRAHEETKKISNMKDKTLRSEMESAGKQAKKLAVSYARIHLGNPDLFSNDSFLKGLCEDLRSVLKVSVLGNFQQPLRALSYLVKLPVGAKSLVNHPWWIPKGVHLNGRVIEMISILGPFFHVSALPDHTIFKSQPDVGQQCFSDASTRRAADLLSSFTTIKTLMNTLYNDLVMVKIVQGKCKKHSIPEVPSM